jgi:hypothetical protein
MLRTIFHHDFRKHVVFDESHSRLAGLNKNNSGQVDVTEAGFSVSKNHGNRSTRLAPYVLGSPGILGTSAYEVPWRSSRNEVSERDV